MNKSVYSLVLSDEVVSSLDKAAYETGISRSAMANRILAGYLSCQTPEQTIREVFSMMEQAVAGPERLRISSATTDSFFQLKSALSYKYNPTLRYTVELCRPLRREDGLFLYGRLKVTLRSRNDSLLELFQKFVTLWSWAENINNVSAGELEAEGRFSKDLLLDEGNSLAVSKERLADATLSYIRLMDDCMETFFKGLESETSSALSIENKYESFMKSDAFLFR